jgi:hypothetical protein
MLFADVAVAQHEGSAGTAPPPRPGPGQLTVQIIADSGGESVAGLSIALYALAPDGTPGLTDGVTDSEGSITFSGISNDPEIVYLVGARYADIPFGERVAFEAGVTQARVEIQVSAPTDLVSGVRIEELRARIDWMGDRVVVTEILRLVSSGDRVIQLTGGDSNEAIIRRSLPEQASDFSAGPSSIGDGLAFKDGQVHFWGPLYPGEQRIEFRYSLPVNDEPSADTGPRTLLLAIELEEPAERMVVVAGTPGIEAVGAGLISSREVASDSGQPLASWARGPIRAGERLEIALTLPESRLDASALSIPRADVWVELDDTRLTANVDLQLLVEPGTPVSGTQAAPLLHISLPSGATLEGVAPEAEAMGLLPTSDGGFDVTGPIGPGQQSLAYSYRLPGRVDGVQLDMRFPREVATLNVLIADTGLSLDSSRLHRRRPFRNGTRNYLHREAFHVEPDEVVDLTLEPLRGDGLPQQASIALTIAGGFVAAFFLITPLRRITQPEAVEDPELTRIRDERESVYVAIEDLDHDFETGKLDESDYTEMRTRFRNQAIDLLRIEHSGGQAANGTAPTAATLSTSTTTTTAATLASPIAIAPSPGATALPTTGKFCPDCGGSVDPSWRFCSHCGGGLNPDLGAAAEETSA